MKSNYFENIVKRQCRYLFDQGERPFISDETESYSCRSFVAAVLQKINMLRRARCGKNESVVLGAAQGLDFFILLVAVWMMDCVAIPIDRSSDQESVDYIIKKARPRLVLGLDPECRIHLTDEDDYVPQKYPDYTAAVLFTSGSLGTPKGVILSSEALFGNAAETLKVLNIGHKDHLFVNIPYHFTSAICHFLAAFFNPVRLTIIQKKLFPTDLATAVKISGANAFGGAPIQLLWLIETSDKDLNLRWCMTSGDDLPESTQKRLKDKFPKTHLFVFYGLTEAGGRLCVREPLNESAGYCSVGRPISGMAVKIIDSSGKIVPIGKIGEVVAYGRFLMNGYLGKSEPSFHSDGGFKSGDSGYLDENENLYLLGRLDDVFKVAGQKVSGLRIRDAILRTGMVEDAVVIPFRNTNVGVMAGVVYATGGRVDFDKSEFLRMLRRSLPTNHIPRKLIAVDRIKRTGSGKVARKNLIDTLKELNYFRQEDNSYIDMNIASR